MQSSELQQRGRALREEVMRRRKELAHSNSLRANVMNDPDGDVSALVARYIPVGISFDDASTILRAAGYTIHQPRPKDDPVYATLPPQSQVYPSTLSGSAYLFRWLFGNTEILITLYPDTPHAAHPRVERVEGRIVVNAL